ncbi:MAG: RNA polymerase subunit sigma-24, partial [Candidatus Staskawiczbacteria bacterium]|nr:RNA polymerase subunit sigma-24 [Candidatus Staskawiczbacteria bacterium]
MNNNEAQFSEIYDQYIDKIYRFVYFKVNSQEIAEDITSKVFLKGWEAY